MKKLSYLILLILGLVIFFGCEQDDILFTQDMTNVGFYGTSASVMEVDNDMKGRDTVTLQILVSALVNSPSCEVTFDVDDSWYKEIDGHYYEIIGEDTTLVNPAMEGVDFEVVGEKKVTVTEGYGYAPVVVAAIDNDMYDPLGDKQFRLKITGNNQGYNLSSEYIIKVTIIDDDHPLGWLFGDYTANITETANGDLIHSIKIVAVDGEVDKVKIYGMAGQSFGPPLSDPYFILGTVSEDNSEVMIKIGQAWDSWGWGSCELVAWEDDYQEGEVVEELKGKISTEEGVLITFRQTYAFGFIDGPNVGAALQWALNSDEAPNSVTAVWKRN